LFPPPDCQFHKAHRKTHNQTVCQPECSRSVALKRELGKRSGMVDAHNGFVSQYAPFQALGALAVMRMETRRDENTSRVCVQRMSPGSSRRRDWILELKNRLRKSTRLYDAAQYLIGPVLRNDRLEKQFRQIVRQHPEKVFWNFGGGGFRGFSNFKNLDCYLGPNVDLVADLHAIPLVAQSLDGVTCVAVLEHVKSPAQVVRETFRVMKPGAIAHFNVPFMQPYHASPADYQRFTSSGLRHLFREFQVLDLQCMGGPASAMVWLTTEFLAIALSFGSRRLHAAWFLCFTVLLWPFKYLDLILRSYSASEIMSSNFSILVRKPAEQGKAGSPRNRSERS